MADERVCAVPGCIKRGVLRKGFCEPHYDRFKRYGTPYGGGVFRGVPLAWLKNRIGHREDACLIWPYGTKNKGYGSVKYKGRDEYCHRLMCEWKHGPAPSPDHEAAHNCGNGHKGCVNPLHLRWATRSENQKDKMIHGTANIAERNHFARMSAEQARAIKSAKGSCSPSEAAAMFGVTRGNIKQIWSGKRWAWLNQG